MWSFLLLCCAHAVVRPLVLDLLRSHRMLEQRWSFYLRPHTAEVLHTICDEHEAVVTGLKAGELARVCAGLRNHLRGARDATLYVFDQQNTEFED